MGGLTGNTPALVAVIACPIIFFLGICNWLYNRRYARKKFSERGPYRPEYKAYYEKLQSEISLRISQEEDTSKGTAVWFSRHIERGRFKHWILIIENTKYELRQNHDSSEFFVNVASCPLDHERRQAAYAEKLYPEYDGHYVCLIGWTHKSREEIEELAQQIGKGWDYSRFTNNCQHYLRLLSDEILTADKAADYPWFYDNTRTEYLNSRQPPPPPEIVEARQKAQANHMAHHNAVQQHQHHQHMHQLDMQTINQMTLQNLQNTNMQMQMMNNPAMNPGLNMASNPAMNPAAFGTV